MLAPRCRFDHLQDRIAQSPISTPRRAEQFERICLAAYPKIGAMHSALVQAIEIMAKGGLVADLVAVIASIDPVMGGVDR